MHGLGTPVRVPEELEMLNENVLQVLDDLDLGWLQAPAQVVLEGAGVVGRGHGRKRRDVLGVGGRVSDVGTHHHAWLPHAGRTVWTAQQVVDAVQFRVHFQQNVADRRRLLPKRQTNLLAYCGSHKNYVILFLTVKHFNNNKFCAYMYTLRALTHCVSRPTCSSAACFT